MPKRNLRIIRRVKNVPVLGICEYCNMQFSTELHPHIQQGEAQAAIQQQFNVHKCKRADLSPAAAGVVSEATENK